MKKFIAWIVFALAMTAHAAQFDSDAINLMNNHWGSVPRQLQLGTALGTVSNLASGKILVGNSSGTSAAVTPSGDVTISNSGVTAIGAGKVLESMVTIADGKVLIGNGSNVAVARTLSGDVTTSNAGVTAIGAGKVLESMLAVPTSNALNAARVARFKFDPSANAGDRTVAAHGLGVTLPAKSIITRSYFIVETPVVSVSNNGTIALSCETANNIFSAADIDADSADTIKAGVSDGAVANMQQITAACEITATVGTNALTAGKLIGWVEYVVTE